MDLLSQEILPEDYFINDEPYYEPIADEIQVFESAYNNQLPVLLKGLPVAVKHVLWNIWRGDLSAP